MTEQKSTSGIFAAVLAAGSASRFGSTKQLAKLDGVPLVTRTAEIAAGACGDRTVLVLGHDWKSVNQAADLRSGFLVINNKHTDGIGTSIAMAVRSIRHAARALVVLLADQPMITAQHVRALCDIWSGADNEIVATSYAGTLGVPALFPNACFEDLAKLTSDKGAQHLLHDERFQVQTVDFEPAVIDVDTPEDLRRISRSARS